MTALHDRAPERPAATPYDSVPPRSPGLDRRLALFIVIGTALGVVALAVAGLAIFYLGVRSTEVSAGSAGSATTAVAPPADVVADAVEGEPTEVSPSEVIDGFAAAWSSGDWDAARTVATDEVVATAEQGFSPGTQVTPIETTTPLSGELLVTAPEGGSALVYMYRISEIDGAVLVTDLTFAGDAG